MSENRKEIATSIFYLEYTYGSAHVELNVIIQPKFPVKYLIMSEKKPSAQEIELKQKIQSISIDALSCDPDKINIDMKPNQKEIDLSDFLDHEKEKT